MKLGRKGLVAAIGSIANGADYVETSGSGKVSHD